MRWMILILVLAACNPVKKVLQDPKKYAQVREEIIRRGDWERDTTIIETVKDSLIYREKLVKDSILVPCKDFDTTMSDGARISVSSGVLKYQRVDTTKEKQVVKYREVKTRDRSFENILKGDILKLEAKLSGVRDSLTKSQANVSQLTAEKKSLKKDITGWKIKFWAVIGLAFVWTFRKPLIRMIWPSLK